MGGKETRRYITVIGATNMDISGTPDFELVESDSNPGQIGRSFGGVGRNIAENIKRLGGRVELITAFGDDEYANQIKQNCEELGIGTRHSVIVEGGNTSTYLCINEWNGDMKIAISEMKIYQKITPEHLQKKMEVLEQSTLVVVDGNIPEESIGFIAENCSVPILAEPVSTKKGMKFFPVLGKLAAIKPNCKELGSLAGIKIKNEQDIDRALDILLEKGIREIYASLGKNGAVYASRKKRMYIPCYEGAVVNTTGCGDAFMAGIAWGLMNGWKDIENMRIGLAAASLCIEQKGAISPKMKKENIWKIIGNTAERMEII